MAKKQMVITLMKEKGLVQIEGFKTPIEIKKPEGCIGIMYAWESKAAAYHWYGKKVPTVRIEYDKSKKGSNKEN